MSSTSPISVSTSTTAMCVPEGQLKFGGSYTNDASSPGSMPSGRLCAVQAWSASSLVVSDLPFALNVPFSYSSSSSPTSSWCAAILRAFSTTRSAAWYAATPPTVRLRLPYVSLPSGATAVSPWSTSTSSYGIPRRSATIWENVVTWLCPCGEVPISTCTVPVGRKRIVAASQPPAP